ncbi:MAG: 50S ribosomal protein L23 [Malacoplasma sp.]
MNLLDVIIKPLYSEKAYGLKSEEKKKYVFEVAKNSNKVTINLAFQMIYGIIPEKVNICNRKPVPIKQGTKNPGFSKHKKIAYITLPIGMDIAVEEEKTEPTKKASKIKKILGQ